MRNVFIIGCGDVVINRLYPAISKAKNFLDITVYDINLPSKNIDGYKYLPDQEKIVQDILQNIQENDVIWVSTPPNAHVWYLERLIDAGALIVLEKPITTNKEELEKVKEIISDPQKRNKIFFLSYYILEKALPLTYLAQNIRNNEKAVKFYEKYLDISTKNDLIKILHGLGSLKSIEVTLMEGKDNRNWVSQKESGGHMYETFLHNALIAAEFCELPTNSNAYSCHKIYSFTNGQSLHCVQDIEFKGLSKDTLINLKMSKDSPIIKRNACLVFERGKIIADFNKQNAKIYTENNNIIAEISVNKAFLGKYEVMTNMVSQINNNETTPDLIDGLENQIQLLYWLHILE